MKFPFTDLASQYESLKSDIDQAVLGVLAHGQYILGPEVEELERQLSDYVGGRYCITCANGTDALTIALMAAGVTAGDEVIVPSFSYIATAEAAALLGAKVVYVDINLGDYSIDVDQVKEKLTARTKAVIPVSLYGAPGDFNALEDALAGHPAVIIEDAAQSFGASRDGVKSCALSKIACTSFFPSKPLGCYGDGGAVFTDDPELAKSIRMIARHGQVKRYHHEVIGMNSRLDTIQAAILLVKLRVLEEERIRRCENARRYNSLLIGEGLVTPRINDKIESAWAQYTVRSTRRDVLVDALRKNEIPVAIHYPLPLHLQPAVFDKSVHAPNSERAALEVLSLPVSASLTATDVEFIAAKVLKALRG